MIKISAHFGKKVGEPNYGSRAASVTVEAEIDVSPTDGDTVMQATRRLFALARTAVESEIFGRNGYHYIQEPTLARLANPEQITKIRQLFAYLCLDQNHRVSWLKAYGAIAEDKLTAANADNLIRELKKAAQQTYAASPQTPSTSAACEAVMA